jgi:hypothetical protein
MFYFYRENVCKQFALLRQIVIIPTGTLKSRARAEPEIPPEMPLLAPAKTNHSNNQPEAWYLFLQPIRPPAIRHRPFQAASSRAAQGQANGDSRSALPPPLSQPVVPPPAWANAVVARTSQTAAFDIQGSYWVKPNFLRVLRAVEGVHPAKLVFQYREVTSPRAEAGRQTDPILFSPQPVFLC